MTRKYEIFPGLFWIGLSLSTMIGAYKLDLGDFRDPGAGLMPFLVGGALFLVSLPGLLKSVFKMTSERSEGAGPGKINVAKVVSVSGALFAYCLFLQKLGYLITTTVLLALLFRIASSRTWRVILIISVITSVVSYLGFSYLGLRFPRGILGI